MLSSLVFQSIVRFKGHTSEFHWHCGGTLAALSWHCGGTLAALWRHSRGTVAALSWHCGGTLAAVWRHSGGTLMRHSRGTLSALSWHSRGTVMALLCLPPDLLAISRLTSLGTSHGTALVNTLHTPWKSSSLELRT